MSIIIVKIHRKITKCTKTAGLKKPNMFKFCIDNSKEMTYNTNQNMFGF